MSEDDIPDDREARLAAGMAAAQQGDADAYRFVLHQCVSIIAATARARGVDAGRIDDVVQETLITIHRARATYDPARPFLPWLRAIASRRAIDSLRGQERHGRREVHDAFAYDTHADPAPGVVHELERRDDLRHLSAVVETLPESQRQAVRHLALEERSLGETAALTGRSKIALKVNLHRGIRALRAKLAGTYDDHG
ncbi:RNA polymerase, sigma subunit, ECF family [Arboricoccus pini]|uniref:RNA polymerase, sigma subunit, ECF family n=1 Tax=Arboricoccus pini TaxID=1963835 RepID=A0A212S0C4_9PROT|nr:sigma-70 family RNA polymerase sigma factor [Arboricoccus pini]SNB78595.1 RNA polymerase, sigma subunit, ECF family [Arboricoccus pini]